MTRRDNSGLASLWSTVPPATRRFGPDMTAGLPEAAACYLRHAIAPGTPVPSAVRLGMRGTIRLGRGWRPFRAEQVSHWGRGFVWRASSRIMGLPVTGYDRLVDGQGEMHWRLLGMVPVMRASGPDLDRSAAGRINAEALWLPSVLLAREVELRPGGPDRVEGIARAHGDETPFWMTLDTAGSVTKAGMTRWGNPDGRGYRWEPFGGIIEGDRTFGGITIPTRVRMGWFFGSSRFEPEGEFFRAEVEAAEFR